MQLLTFTNAGIYCHAGDFYIDPWQKVSKAIITHAHSDHARWGMGHYWAHHHSVPIMKLRLGADISVTGVNYGESLLFNGVKVSLHPAGHIIGSAQIRVEYKGEVWVVSGDYKTVSDGVCEPFEPIKCHTFVTECTFGMPIYRWKPQEVIFGQINRWFHTNFQNGINSILVGYSLGKAQRLLANLGTCIENVYLHTAISNIQQAYQEKGIIKNTYKNASEWKKNESEKTLILAPPAAVNTPWMRKFEPFSIGIASGWMAIRGNKRRRNADAGFVLSDHADWPQLLDAISNTGAENIYATHGFTAVLSRYLQEKGYNANEVNTLFEGEKAE